MARKKKLSPNETETNQTAQLPPIVTPEIADGYDGVVKRLVCSGCQRVFYVTEADYQSLHPTNCHNCSKMLLAEYEAKLQREKTEQEKQAKGKIVQALVDDMLKDNEDTPEEAHIRSIVETKNKKDTNYGFTMLLCIPRHSEKGKAWDVTITKEEQYPKRSIHRRIAISEMGTNAYFVLPYAENIFYDVPLEAEVKQLDAAIAQHPTDPVRYALKAEKLAKLGENQQALLWYDKAIDVEASSSYAYSKKGDLLEQLDRLGEAMECYEKVISLAPDDTFGYTQKARLLEKLDREEEAEALYDTYIATHPTDLQGYIQKAIFYTAHGKYDEAQAIHQKGKLASQT